MRASSPDPWRRPWSTVAAQTWPGSKLAISQSSAMLSGPPDTATP
jgi:hypothetical protein